MDKPKIRLYTEEQIQKMIAEDISYDEYRQQCKYLGWNEEEIEENLKEHEEDIKDGWYTPLSIVLGMTVYPCPPGFEMNEDD